MIRHPIVSATPTIAQVNPSQKSLESNGMLQSSSDSPSCDDERGDRQRESHEHAETEQGH